MYPALGPNPSTPSKLSLPHLTGFYKISAEAFPCFVVIHTHRTNVLKYPPMMQEHGNENTSPARPAPGGEGRCQHFGLFFDVSPRCIVFIHNCSHCISSLMSFHHYGTHVTLFTETPASHNHASWNKLCFTLPPFEPVLNFLPLSL